MARYKGNSLFFSIYDPLNILYIEKSVGYDEIIQRRQAEIIIVYKINKCLYMLVDCLMKNNKVLLMNCF